ncbi:MAG: hypothetical protein IJ914_08520 [Prevotella sp.]|nr:hypothetical protein [Prevotella sp.]
MMCTMLVQAQQLGDYMEIGGVPGFVFYLDESGEHGLVMSFYKMDEKDAKKLAKKGNLAEEKALRLALPEKEKIKVKSKEMDAYREDLASLLTDDGKYNRMAIADYCKKNNLDLSIFKGQDFAAFLGDGWFIPGDNELEKFAKFYVGGLGEGNSFSVKAIINNAKEKCSDPLVQDILYRIAFCGIRSSSLKDPKWGFRALVRWAEGGFKVKEHYEIVDKIKTTKFSYGSIETTKLINGLKTCAVHEF